MKKPLSVILSVIVSIILFVLLLITLCVFIGLYRIKPAPYDYPNTTWESKTPYIRFTVPDEYANEYTTGIIIIDNKEYPIEFTGVPGSWHILAYEEGAVEKQFCWLSGGGYFKNPDTFVMIISENNTGIDDLTKVVFSKISYIEG